MKLIVLSDLHICTDEDRLRAIHLNKLMKKQIELVIVKNEPIIILILGDIIHHDYAPDAFEWARQVLIDIKNNFDDLNAEYMILPGNHDLYNEGFEEFDSIASEFTNTVIEYSRINTYSFIKHNMNFILTSSVLNGEYRYGEIDFSEIEDKIDKTMNNILVCHHGPYSEWSDDHASIRGVSKLQSFNEIKYLFHGHVHGGSESSLLGLNKIGVGSAYVYQEDIPSQFLIMDSENGDFIDGVRYYYAKDMYSGGGYSSIKMDLPFTTLKVSHIEEEIRKEEYKQPDDYVMRNLYHLTSKEISDNLIIRSNQLYNFCKNYKSVVLIGEAGSGKSYELSFLSSLLEDNSVPYEPVLLKLNLYDGENLEELIIEEFGNIFSRIFLLLDAYDEIEPIKLKVFKRKLNNFMRNYPRAIVLITCRSNFYKKKLSEDFEIEGSLEKFEELYLKAFTKEDIISYLVSHGISEQRINIVSQNNILMSLFMNPFFLALFTKAEIAGDIINQRSDIMKFAISRRNLKDEDKFREVNNSEEIFETAKPIIQRIAFALRCLNKNHLTESEFKQLVSFTNREKVKYLGYWNYNESIWKFTHNNFMEYLAAVFLNSISFDKAISTITYDDGSNRLNQAWKNVLSFSIDLENTNILKWVIENEPQIVTSFDDSRLTKKIKTDILIKSLVNLKEKNMWFGQDRNSSTELIICCQTYDVIKFVISEIDNPLHFRALYNAVKVISEITNSFGLDEEIKDSLLKVCFCLNSSVRGHEKRAAIVALCERGYYDLMSEKKLVEVYMDELDNNIRNGIYEYLVKFDGIDRNIEFFIKGMEIKNSIRDGITNASEEYWLEQGLKKLKTVDSVKKVFQFLINPKDCYRVPVSEETYAKIISIARILTIKGEYDFFDEVKELYVHFVLVHYTKLDEDFFEFFDSTGNRIKLYEYILNTYSGNDKKFVLKRVMNEECIEDFFEKYKKDEVNAKNFFPSYVEGLRPGNDRFQEFCDEILKREGRLIEVSECFDYVGERKIQTQSYFDRLFNKNSYADLIKELGSITDEEINLGELSEIEYYLTETRHDLSTLQWDLYHWDKMEKLNKFIDNVDWQLYSINCIRRMLKNNLEIVINGDQKKYIENYCRSLIKKENIFEGIKYNDDGSMSISYDIRLLAYLSNFLNIEYEVEELLEMLMIPAYFFDEKGVSEKFPDYLISKIDQNTVTNYVKRNLRERMLKGDVARAHFKYCMENNISEGVEVATEFCQDNSSNTFDKRLALEYIDSIKGKEFIIDSFVETEDVEFLNLIINIFFAIPNKKLETRLLKENRSSEDGLKYLYELIAMNSNQGLCRFVELVRENKNMPNSENKCGYYSIRDIFDKITDINLLPYFNDLIDLRFTDGFKDGEFYSIYGILSVVLKNFAEQNYKLINGFIEEKLEHNKENLDMRSFLNYVKEDIEMVHYSGENSKWEISELKELLNL